ncbi:MAG: hypothetical protein ACKVQS_01065 [Fimbriimonadaceae bacterium]
MSTEDQNIEEVTTDTVAEAYVAEELASLKKSMTQTQIFGSAFVFILMCYMFSIANGFAQNFEPKTAAKITKGLVAQKLDDVQPQVSEYLKREIPTMIKNVPDMAKSQLPIMRENIETTVEAEISDLATKTSGQLDQALDSFLVEKQDEFKTIILAGQDKETTDEVAKAMREMFVDYLTEDHGQDESIQTKLDESLKALKEIAHRTHRMAYATDLDAVEKKTRRAVACLFSTVREHKGQLNLPTQEGAQQTVAGLLESANDSTPR